MAAKMSKRGQIDNEVTYEFMCDETADLQSIEPRYITMGSTAIVIDGDNGFEVYMANSLKNWINLGSAVGNNQNQNENNISNLSNIVLSFATIGGYAEDYQQEMSVTNNVITGKLFRLTYDNNSYFMIEIYLAEINTNIGNSFIGYNSRPGIYPVLETRENNSSQIVYFPAYNNDDVYALSFEDNYTPISIKVVNFIADDTEIIKNATESHDSETLETFSNLILTKEVLAEYDVSQLQLVDY